MEKLKVELTIVAVLFSIIFASHISFGAEIFSVYTKPTPPIWIEYDSSAVSVNFYVQCVFNGTQYPIGVLTYPDGTSAPVNFVPSNQTNTYVSQRAFLLSRYGTYTLQVTCRDSSGTYATKSISFTIYKMMLQILSPTPSNPLQIYAETPFEIKLRYQVNGKDITPLEDPEFSGYLIDSNNNVWKLVLANPPRYDKNTHYWYVDFKTITYNIPPGTYSLKVLASAIVEGVKKQAEASSLNSIMVNDYLQIHVISPPQGQAIKVTDASNVNVTVQVLEKGVPVEGLTTSNFKVYLLNGDQKQELAVKKVVWYQDTQRYGVTFFIPQLEPRPKPYYVEIVVSHGACNPATSRKIPIWLVVPFSGVLKDANGNVVSARIRLINNQGVFTVTTNRMGQYKIMIPAGIYDIEMSFPAINLVDIKDVDISGPAINRIKYDAFKGNPGIEGLKIYKIAVLEFGLPFKSATLQIPYDERYVRNERALKVFLCPDWNFALRKCEGTWEDVYSRVDVVGNQVYVNTTKLGAFALGERYHLLIFLNKFPTNYYAKSRIYVSGVVKDDDGKGVANVLIKYWIKNTKIEGSVNTTKGGVFSFVTTAPMGQGSYELVIQAIKPPYISYEVKKVIHVQIKRELDVYSPDVVTIYPGKQKIIDIVLANTGQVPFKDISLSLVGLKYDWYLMVPDHISVIEPGENKTVQIHVLIPKNETGNLKLNKYFFVTVKVNGENLTKTTSFTVKLTPYEYRQKSNETEKAEATEKSSLSISGFSIAKISSKVKNELSGLSINLAQPSASNINEYLVFLFVALGFVIVTIKKRKRYGKGIKKRKIPFPKV